MVVIVDVIMVVEVVVMVVVITVLPCAAESAVKLIFGWLYLIIVGAETYVSGGVS